MVGKEAYPGIGARERLKIATPPHFGEPPQKRCSEPPKDGRREGEKELHPGICAIIRHHGAGDVPG